ncbi:unnamed protein product [Linum tenue]|uniref:RNase H type-1 domain-containing protein n=1 Tax=Linum tenue TaxID=586396 RepID=A0AAV0HL18_9ROSI|nr:unnamed protein product [Linum tenue]
MPFMRKGLFWSLRDGTDTGFWSHPWLDNETTLEELALCDLSDEERTTSVADWLDGNGMEAPKAGLGEDRTIWGAEKDGRFRLRSAYNLVVDEKEEEPMDVWKQLWRWNGPNRVKLFLWLVTHDRLLTNAERKKRQLTSNDECNFCKDEVETTEHIIRRCKKAGGIWNHFSSKVTEKNTNIDFQTWLNRNLKADEVGVDFGIVCWLLWKQRNDEVMEGKKFSEEGMICRIQAWFSIHQQALRTNKTCFGPVTSQRTIEDIGWKPPEEGWIQLQTDGSVITSLNSAAAGGLLRDRLGRCLDAFSCNLGDSSITSAELKGAVEGLERAWRKGYRKIELNMDSMTAISIMNSWKDDNHRHGLLAAKVGNLISREWEVKISHVFREQNKAADFLASRGHSLHFGIHHISVCEPVLTHWLLYDSLGITMPRSISNMN